MLLLDALFQLRHSVAAFQLVHTPSACCGADPNQHVPALRIRQAEQQTTMVRAANPKSPYQQEAQPLLATPESQASSLATSPQLTLNYLQIPAQQPRQWTPYHIHLECEK